MLIEVVDIHGCNYLAIGIFDKLLQDFPNKPISLSEFGSTLSTRCIYTKGEELSYYRSYDVHHAPWGKTTEKMWKFCAERDWLVGTFVWTGFDYCDEPHPRSWPCVHATYRFIDRAGFLKDNYYYYKAWWSDEPLLHVLPHWNWQEKMGQPIDIWSH